ncbi:hypothetical protein TNCV_300831 [Trichonephila clavipes]|nr:hypothetical protein TNCV_300831 [Trichonephila clavipes]
MSLSQQAGILFHSNNPLSTYAKEPYNGYCSQKCLFKRLWCPNVFLGSKWEVVCFQHSRLQDRRDTCLPPGMREEYTVSFERLQYLIWGFRSSCTSNMISIAGKCSTNEQTLQQYLVLSSLKISTRFGSLSKFCQNSTTKSTEIHCSLVQAT